MGDFSKRQGKWSILLCLGAVRLFYRVSLGIIAENKRPRSARTSALVASRARVYATKT
jgi:hypothetical protein